MTPKEVTPGDIARAYQEVFATEAGHLVLADLQHKFGFTRRSMFEVAGGDPTKVVFCEGQRSVLVYIGRLLETDPNELDKQAKEAEL